MGGQKAEEEAKGGEEQPTTQGFREFCFLTPFRAKLKIDFAFDHDKIMNQNK